MITPLDIGHEVYDAVRNAVSKPVDFAVLDAVYGPADAVSWPVQRILYEELDS